MSEPSMVESPRCRIAVVFGDAAQHGEWEAAQRRLMAVLPDAQVRLHAELPATAAPAAWKNFREHQALVLGPGAVLSAMPESGQPDGEGALLWMIPRRSLAPVWIIAPPVGGAATEVVLSRPVLSVRMRLPVDRRKSPLLLQTILPSDFVGCFAQAWVRRADAGEGLLWLVPSRVPGSAWSQQWLSAARRALNDSPCRVMPLRECAPDAALVALLRGDAMPSVIVASPIVAPLLAEAAALSEHALGVAPCGYVGGLWPVARAPIAARPAAAGLAWPAAVAMALSFIGDEESSSRVLAQH